MSDPQIIYSLEQVPNTALDVLAFVLINNSDFYTGEVCHDLAVDETLNTAKAQVAREWATRRRHCR